MGDSRLLTRVATYLCPRKSGKQGRLALARSKETHIHAFGLDLDMTGKGNNGHFAPFDWAA